ncbi:HemK2/MTQ2 family protein methyltransferase [Streptomyces sp. NBC_01280]|uniref:HemK2/MTQ2 family protein methyltransferase n=1 Tax=Streptomyces sp. NBC_01280 TaxID=2903810 RepID=UPI003FCD7320
MESDDRRGQSAPAPSHPPRLLTPPGVYAPQSETQILVRALCGENIGPTTGVLDLGTGSGALAVQAARTGDCVTAIDISWRAVWAARLNACLSRHHVTVRRGDLTSGLQGRSYDIIVSNPPYAPCPSASLTRRGKARSWDAGPDGRALVDRICDAAPAALRPSGVLLLVQSALSGTEATLERLAGTGLHPAVVDRARIPFGPVLRSRTAWLRRRGLVGEESWEELVVIRAEKF